MGLFDFFGKEDEQEVVEQPFKIENPSVKDYMSKYSNDAREKLQGQIKEESSGPNILGALAAFGTGLQGGNAAEAGMNFVKNQQAKRDKKITDFDSGRKNAMEQDGFAKESDPNSDESKLAQEAAIKLGVNPDRVKNMTAAQFKAQGPVFSKMYEVDQRKLDRSDARSERTAARNEKMEEKMQGLKTPYGLANNVDDASKLKQAHEMKKGFDSKLEEMIALRNKHSGGAIINRDDVGRGKQLSKDLLLAYKDLAKLGVLSVSDENILNEIIPQDPLEYNSIFAGVTGQDPTLHKLKKFKGDSDKDFSTRVATRTRQGLENYAQGIGPKSDAPETRTKNGKMYVKHGNGWIPAESVAVK